MLCDDRDMDWSDAATAQFDGTTRRQEKTKGILSYKFLSGFGSDNTLSLVFWTLEVRKIKFLLFKATLSAVLLK